MRIPAEISRRMGVMLGQRPLQPPNTGNRNAHSSGGPSNLSNTNMRTVGQGETDSSSSDESEHSGSESNASFWDRETHFDQFFEIERKRLYNGEAFQFTPGIEIHATCDAVGAMDEILEENDIVLFMPKVPSDNTLREAFQSFVHALKKHAVDRRDNKHLQIHEVVYDPAVGLTDKDRDRLKINRLAMVITAPPSDIAESDVERLKGYLEPQMRFAESVALAQEKKRIGSLEVFWTAHFGPWPNLKHVSVNSIVAPTLTAQVADDVALFWMAAQIPTRRRPDAGS